MKLFFVQFLSTLLLVGMARINASVQRCVPAPDSDDTVLLQAVRPPPPAIQPPLSQVPNPLVQSQPRAFIPPTQNEMVQQPQVAPLPDVAPPAYQTLPKVFNFILEQSNVVRKHHNARPLRWNQALADAVYKQASLCQQTVADPHFVTRGFTSAQNWAGGNPCERGSGLNCRVKQKSAPWRWYEYEQPLWNYNTRTCAEDWHKCGHFVIEAQPSATEMGCAIVDCPSLGGVSLYCDYLGVTDKHPWIFPNRNQHGLQLKLIRHYLHFISENY